ncbi:hypothetical protein HDU91_005640 [Kappamyces sp. JEL0680]|nr:hypothetical protein HDU91_005640 [Kappamyces sp. JEL0680]
MSVYEQLYLKINQLESLRLFTNPAFARQTAKLHPALNRYSDIFPFDKDRVVLHASPSSTSNGYINASYCTSLRGHFKYIAAQGPLPQTVNHFWEMVWQEKSVLIVMLTPLVESKRIKCHKYWPDAGAALDLGLSSGLRVEHLEHTKVAPDLAQTSFRLESGSEKRRVELLHFTGWGDHQDSDVQQVIRLVEKAAELQGGSATPMVVHCSAGVGRTGTFITIHSIWQEAKIEPALTGPYYTPLPDEERGELPPNDVVAQTVNHLRRSRVASVQTIEQFVLCYLALEKMLHP